MKCYYEILSIAMDSTAEDIKKAYRKLALEWHPDKNLHQLQEATEQFQLIQQAYDVLSDPHERAWYDRHRDKILKGGLDEDYKDNSVDVFQYFNTSCFSGYGDDAKSFYTVYQNVFDQIAAEDRPFMEDDVEIPRFGSSDSPYEEIVHPFYSYWQSYCTQKPFYWMDKYDIREAPNRRVLRLMEKENKKLRDQAKKKRNEEVRHLVEYVRKRDKRVQAYKIKLEEKSAENARKMEQERRRQILERQKNLENYKETEWASMSQLEGNLQEIEAHLDKEFGRESREKANYDNGSSISNSDDGESNADLYCAACDKAFRSDKAFNNHERSKKHKQNVAALKEILQDEEECFATKDTEVTLDTSEEQNRFVLMTDLRNEHEEPSSRKGKKKKQRKSHLKNDTYSDQEETEEAPEFTEQCEHLEDVITSNSDVLTKSGSTVSKENHHFKDAAVTINSPDNLESKEDEHLEDGSGMKYRKNKGQKKTSKSSKDAGSQNTCFSCHTEFLSRNKLFEHLKSTGHAMYIPPTGKASKEESKHGLQEKSKPSQRKGKR